MFVMKGKASSWRPCIVRADHVLFSTNIVPWGYAVTQSCCIGISQLTYAKSFDGLSLWSIYHVFLVSYFRGLRFFAFESFCAFFLFSILNFFLFLCFFFPY